MTKTKNDKLDSYIICMIIEKNEILLGYCYIILKLGPYHIDDELAKALALPLGKVLENVTVFLVQKLEAHGEVVVLQY